MQSYTDEFVEIPPWIMIIQSHCKHGAARVVQWLALSPHREKVRTCEGFSPGAPDSSLSPETRRSG